MMYIDINEYYIMWYNNNSWTKDKKWFVDCERKMPKINFKHNMIIEREKNVKIKKEKEEKEFMSEKKFFFSLL